jgi:hypothetical protein
LARTTPKALSAQKAWGCLVVICLTLSVGLVGGAYLNGYLPIRFFDSADWKAADYWDGTRVQMIEHLQWSEKLDGLKKAEVIALLGRETDTTYFSDHDLVYALGPERGWLSLDSEWLVIDFDRDGVVASYQVVAD